MSNTSSPVKTFPWGGAVLVEISLNKRSANKFYARHARNADGRDYIEFTKFGPIPNEEDKSYNQKLRIFSPVQWVQLKHYVETDLVESIGWNLENAEREFKSMQQKELDEEGKNEKSID